MNFAAGDKITKKRNAPWVLASPGAIDHVEPLYGEVHVVRGGGFSFYMQQEYVLLVGFADCYSACAFERVVERKSELPACLTALLDSKNHTPLPARKLDPSRV